MNIAIDVLRGEQDFITACVNKEKWALKKLYEDFYSKMLGVCLRYSNNHDDASDILHEGFIKVFRNISKYQPGTSLNAWIRRIMVNASIDFYRKETRRRTEDLETVYDVSMKGADAVSQMTAKEILECIQILSPAYRSVFNLYVIEGYSHREVAEILGITESTSRSNLVKARIKLKQLIAYRQIG